MTHIRRPLSLRDRVSLLVTIVAVVLSVAGGTVWLAITRAAIHEEVEAAARVAEQWLLATRMMTTDPQERIATLASVGRLRANQLEIFDSTGERLYVSPAPTYKAGRDAPAWFARLIAPPLEERNWIEGPLTIRLQPDTSRAALDAWDQLMVAAGWSVAALILLVLAVRYATARVMAPLTTLEDALTRTAQGRFDVRLPRQDNLELDRLAERYNHMVEQLDTTLVRNARLEEDQAFVRALNQRLEDERRAIARELHDEFGQGITAMRAIAGAVAQRSADNAALHGSAQALIAMSSQLQDNVRTILNQLRRPETEVGGRIHDALLAYVVQWTRCYPALTVEHAIDAIERAVPAAYCQTVLRLLQESLTNVARHAHAHNVRIELHQRDERIELCVSDDGRGFDPEAATDRHGLAGMRERVDRWQGHMEVDCPAEGGSRITVELPLPAQGTIEVDTQPEHRADNDSP